MLFCGKLIYALEGGGGTIQEKPLMVPIRKQLPVPSTNTSVKSTVEKEVSPEIHSRDLISGPRRKKLSNIGTDQYQ